VWEDVPDDSGYDSENNSEDEDIAATAGLDLQQRMVQFHNTCLASVTVCECAGCD